MSSREGDGATPRQGGAGARSLGTGAGAGAGAGAARSSQRTPASLAQARSSLGKSPASSSRNLANLPRSDLQASAPRAGTPRSFTSGSPTTPRTSQTGPSNGGRFSQGGAGAGAGAGGSGGPSGSGSSSGTPRTPSDRLSARTPGETPGDDKRTTSTPAGASTPVSTKAGSLLGDINGLIWGTNIESDAATATLHDFFTRYKHSMQALAERREARSDFLASNEGEDVPEELAEDGDREIEDAMEGEESHYLAVLSSLLENQHTAGTIVDVGVDAKHLMAYGDHGEGKKLYNQLVRYPAEIIPLMDLALGNIYSSMAVDRGRDMGLGEGEAIEHAHVRVKVHNLHFVTWMRDLDPEHIDTLVAIKGMVIRTSAIVPDMKVGYFRCSMCAFGLDVQVRNGRVEDPASCEHCGARRTMELVHNRCLYTDKQLIKIQETPESTPEGQSPLTLQVFAYEEMVDSVLPGDRVTITGVFKAQGQRVNPRVRKLKNVFATYIDVIHFQKNDKERMSSEEAVDPREHRSNYRLATDVERRKRQEKIERIVAMSKEPELYVRLANSLAPSVWELEDVKKGVLLQLFGGCNKDLGSLGKIRGEINVLLCGDPGTAKSQLLSYVHRIAPRGMYTSGTGSSAVGLTAYITKDPETKEPVLESGALVLSDRGVCCIDEFDKMSDSTRSILHEVMEQQTVSIAKAGIIATLNARTSILASANPKESRYNPSESVVENLQLPPTLLSRFDLIYLILDKVDRSTDARLARHLVSLHWPEEDRMAEHDGKALTQQLFTREQVMEYISHVKASVDPRITVEAQEALVEGYKAMRRAGMAGGRKTISATTRQLESLIRLGEAHARMRLSPTVDADDVLEAIRLMHVATQQAAVDPHTGAIDMNLISTGHAASEGSTVSLLADALRDFFADTQKKVYSSLGELEKALDQHFGDAPLPAQNDLRAALTMLAEEDSPLLTFSRQRGKEEIRLTRNVSYI